MLKGKILQLADVVNEVELDRLARGILIVSDEYYNLYIMLDTDVEVKQSSIDYAKDWLNRHRQIVKDKLIASSINGYSDEYIKISVSDIRNMVSSGRLRQRLKKRQTR